MAADTGQGQAHRKNRISDWYSGTITCGWQQWRTHHPAEAKIATCVTAATTAEATDVDLAAERFVAATDAEIIRPAIT